MKRIVKKKFFDRAAPIVARELLGKTLVREVRGKRIASMITEVEAYDGPHDRASHAHRGKTPRNEAMFGPAGNWYVYLVYGMHEMLNIVTGPVGYPAAVLIRGTHDVVGPGKLTKYFKITRTQNKTIAASKSGLWIEDHGVRVLARQVMRTPRIGVSYAGEVWAGKKYRFVLKKGRE
ncbi:MAG: 3-methyladenine DNA glycosylase [Candidatus Yonathbacteria bacterium RIFCSPHIGHO2_01_FULL_51_10]|uniref:Putative 3-methyladenine DNA glycosylase n=1 Tax=Candidatus Yonathbacteria bacterium RIFCSPHIGHO2_01_FULL_51_10 TaxID=1802723 RepID=A0A1G2S6C1_9BACT|nr:MAG: 3-methyladenine DNA glycosylase [Candidatus Yonathbacteria bacterium RIFCSPHIGHO2_01_FULL_51_10]